MFQTNKGCNIAIVPLTSCATISIGAPLGLSAPATNANPSGLTWPGRYTYWLTLVR